MIKIAIGVDHRGVALKNYLLANVKKHQDQEIFWIDVGCSDEKYCDYPSYAIEVCKRIRTGEAELGILACGTGIGMAIAANRFSGIYAALSWNEEVARLAREHDKANILVLPSDYVSHEQAVGMIHAWLSAQFLAGKYQRRIDIIDQI